MIALVLRLIPVILTRQLSIGLDDMFQYDMLARSLASGNGFRWYAPSDLARIAPYLHFDPAKINFDPRGIITTFRAPLYPAFLSVIYFVNGINNSRFFAARLTQTVLGALLAPLTYFISMSVPLKRGTSDNTDVRIELPSNPQNSRIAAWIVAAYPSLLIYPIALATENLFFLLVLASVLTLLKLSEVSKETQSQYSIFYSVLSGCLLGLAALTRSVILPFAGLAILWIMFSIKQPQKAIITTVVLIITIAPWIIRNSMIAHKLTGIETSMGYNLYVGYHPQSTGTFIFGPSLDLLSILDDQARDEIGTNEAISFIRQDPGRFPYLAVRRLGYFFNYELRAFTYFYVNDFLGPVPSPLLVIILLLLGLPFIMICLSAVFGASLLPNRPQTILLALLLIGYLLPHIFILSEERFHLTLIPFISICAANIWINGYKALRSVRTSVILIAGVIAILLIVNWGLELIRDGPILTQMIGPTGNYLSLPY